MSKNVNAQLFEFRSGYWKCLQVLFQSWKSHCSFHPGSGAWTFFLKNKGKKTPKQITETWKKQVKRMRWSGSHSSTLVPNVARLVGLRSWKGSSQKKPHIAVNVSKRELNTHRAFTVGSDSSAWGEENPKGVGWGARGQSEEEKREKTFQKDHHRLHTDRHGLPSDRLCYSETKEVGRWRGNGKRVWKTERNTSGNI